MVFNFVYWLEFASCFVFSADDDANFDVCEMFRLGYNTS
jgi:hypothetical protein